MDLPDPISIDGATVDMSDLIHEITQNGYCVSFGCTDKGSNLKCVINDAPICASREQVSKVVELIPSIEIDRAKVDVIKMTLKELYEEINQPEGSGEDE